MERTRPTKAVMLDRDPDASQAGSTLFRIILTLLNGITMLLIGVLAWVSMQQNMRIAMLEQQGNAHAIVLAKIDAAREVMRATDEADHLLLQRVVADVDKRGVTLETVVGLMREMSALMNTLNIKQIGLQAGQDRLEDMLLRQSTNGSVRERRK